MQRLVDETSICKDDTVYEIGPGKGIITQVLADTGAHIIAIELDKHLCSSLQERFAKVENVEIVCADASTYNYPKDRPIKFFSNIPFNITASILQSVLSLPNVVDVYFIMQHEAFLKYAGKPFYQESLKSLYYKPLFSFDDIYDFQPKDFVPAPNVRIVLSHIHREKCSFSSDQLSLYRDFITFIFSENGVDFKQKTKRIFTYEQLKRTSKAAGIAPTCKVTELTYDNWMIIYDSFRRYVSADKQKLVSGASHRLTTNQRKLKKDHRTHNQHSPKELNKH